MTPTIMAEGLVKTYGQLRALDGLDLAVPEGTVLGLLGPNGAGKTTAVRILTTLLQPEAGKLSVAGIDVLKHPQDVRKVIGLSGQYSAVDEHLTGYENLEMIGRLYHVGRAQARKRAHELLELFDLTDAAQRPVKTYSGGMRRRLDLAGALVAQPPVIFMDEPTTGLDPRSRLGMWDVISDRVRQGATLLLTTQYLEEADQLADDIVVIDHGRSIAHGTPDELKRKIGGERLILTLRNAQDLEAALPIMRGVGSADVMVTPEEHLISVPVSHGAPALIAAIRELDAANVEPVDIAVHRPTLDDVFMQLTGQKATAEEEETA